MHVLQAEICPIQFLSVTAGAFKQTISRTVLRQVRKGISGASYIRYGFLYCRLCLRQVSVQIQRAVSIRAALCSVLFFSLLHSGRPFSDYILPNTLIRGFLTGIHRIRKAAVSSRHVLSTLKDTKIILQRASACRKSYS